VSPLCCNDVGARHAETHARKGDWMRAGQRRAELGCRISTRRDDREAFGEAAVALRGRPQPMQRIWEVCEHLGRAQPGLEDVPDVDLCITQIALVQPSLSLNHWDRSPFFPVKQAEVAEKRSVTCWQQNRCDAACKPSECTLPMRQEHKVGTLGSLLNSRMDVRDFRSATPPNEAFNSVAPDLNGWSDFTPVQPLAREANQLLHDNPDWLVVVCDARA
jgi:hypothetical protein